MEYFAWDDAKNAKLRKERGIGCEDVVFHIERGDLLDILEHPHPTQYAGQRVFVVQRDDYVYLVPFVEDGQMIFLKTIIPSRKATKYLEAIQKRALAEGLPYQTLISSLLHKYASGRLKEVQ